MATVNFPVYTHNLKITCDRIFRLCDKKFLERTLKNMSSLVKTIMLCKNRYTSDFMW